MGWVKVVVLSLIGLVAVLKSSPLDIRATELRCEYLTDPINVGTERPRLSWIDESSAHNWQQSAFQILVAKTAASLSRGQGDLWDSGKVDSAETTQIDFGGITLPSRQECLWKVRVWDASGSVSRWSSVSRWEMSLLSEPDWREAKWIGIPGPDGDHPAPYLRKNFTIAEHWKRARIYAVGLGYAEIHLDGRQVAPEAEREPGYTNFDKRVLSVAYDVTSLIRPGRNCLGAVLGTGWYDVHDRATWNFDRAKWRGRPRLRLVLAIDKADGSTQFIASDRSWKAITGPILRDGIYTGEVYDARKEIPGWGNPGFTDTGWAPAAELSTPAGQIAPRPCPGVAISENIKAKSITSPKPGVYIIDFGQNFSGHVKLKMRAPTGTRLTMRYSERVGKDGMIDRSQIEQFMAKTQPPQPFQTDTYIFSGKGTETREQRFSYSGFRYVEVTGLDQKPSLKSF